MAINYPKMQKIAERLLTQNGRWVILRRIVDNPPLNPEKPWEVPLPTVTDTAVKVAFIPKDDRSAPTSETLEARDITFTETQICIIDAISAGGDLDAPNLKAEIVEGTIVNGVLVGAPTKIWPIKLINPMKPGPLPIFYELNLER